MLFLIKVLKNASAARLRSTARWVQAQCGRKMLTIYLDMVWCALRHGAGYCDYANFGFWQLTERQRATLCYPVPQQAHSRRAESAAAL